MRMESADRLAKIIIGLQAILISLMLLVTAWFMQQGEATEQALQGPLLWLFMALLVAAWLWLCRRAWYGYLSSQGMRVQWPFWVLVAVQLPSFPLGTIMGAGLIFLKLKYHPREL
ncbi:hypothetical protein [uncultured Oceanisphaera sp.]|uniref:hypothetical protein n=1 Tax=uncultured Oceanisphaera sp. TaxID=353858 RepID=UPI00260F4E2B|nr:hypothetical protein [uncultured Oceanisphaera sp.]